MWKNVASQIAIIYAFDTATETGKTGDAANITAEISKDAAASAATNDANPTELDATDHPGIYYFDLTQAETNADDIVISAVSATTGVVIEPLILRTVLQYPVVSHPHALDLGFIKQSTAQEIIVGPFLGVSDGLPATGLTVGDITCVLAKQGGSAVTAITLTASAGSNDMVHLSNGFYRVELTASNLDTVGSLTVMFRDDDAFQGPVVVTAKVLPANAYDSLVAGSDYLQTDLREVVGNTATVSTGNLLDVNVAEISDSSAKADALEAAIDSSNNRVYADATAISGDATAADNLESYCDGTTPIPCDVTSIDGDTVAADRLEYLMDGSGSYTVDNTAFTPTTTAFETDATEATADHYKDGVVLFVDGVNAGQRKTITAYALVGGRGKFTVNAFTDAPGNGDRFIII